MQLGFVSAIFGDQPLEKVLAFAADEGFACVELMCWPPGKADRRYAGVTHLDVTEFTDDEWPGGKNVAVSPAVWYRLFEMFPDATLGLNFDPSHLVWQFIDCARAVREFGPNIVHVHAKDERIDRHQLYSVGVLGLGWHTPKLPGLGDVKWGEFFAALTDT